MVISKSFQTEIQPYEEHCNCQNRPAYQLKHARETKNSENSENRESVCSDFQCITLVLLIKTFFVAATKPLSPRHTKTHKTQITKFTQEDHPLLGLLRHQFAFKEDF